MARDSLTGGFDSITEVPDDAALYRKVALRDQPRVTWNDLSGAHDLLLTERIAVGSAPGNAIELADSTVSRIHAELDPRNGTVWVRDLGSRNGTLVENIRVVEAEVPDGEPLPSAEPSGGRGGHPVLGRSRRATQRRDDISLLVEHFAGSRPVPPFPQSMLDELRSRDGPGNVRELRNFVERATALGMDEALGLTSSADSSSTVRELPAVPIDRPFKEVRELWLNHLERPYMVQLLERHHRNISAAAAGKRTHSNPNRQTESLLNSARMTFDFASLKHTQIVDQVFLRE